MRRSEVSVASVGTVPSLDMSPTCKAAAASGLSDRNTEACLKDEGDARNSLLKDWQNYSTTHKAQCTDMVNHGGPSSYVELISCLEAMDGAKNLGDADITGSISGPRR